MKTVDPSTPMPHRKMPSPEFIYPATVKAWMDGDTLDVRLDIGFTSERLERLRLLGVDTPERGQDGWREAGAFVRELAPEGTRVIVRTYRPRPETFGRYIAEVWIAATGEHVGEQLVIAKLARRVVM